MEHPKKLLKPLVELPDQIPNVSFLAILASVLKNATTFRKGSTLGRKVVPTFLGPPRCFLMGLQEEFLLFYLSTFPSVLHGFGLSVSQISVDVSLSLHFAGLFCFLLCVL